jgi:hypothetical protein
MRVHINCALRGNMNLHMYDPTLKLVQAVRNPNPPSMPKSPSCDAPLSQTEEDTDQPAS